MFTRSVNTKNIERLPAISANKQTVNNFRYYAGNTLLLAESEEDL